MKYTSSFLTLLFTFFSCLLFGQEITENSRGLVPNLDQIMNENVQSKKYALVIGSDHYDGKPMWSDLKNAEYDAKSMREILEVKYNFETEILLSPTKNDVLKSIISYHEKLKSGDRFLVFIAGHGDYDKSIYNDGFLVFKDSKPYTEDFARSTYLGYNQLNGILNALPSRHVGLILDVCFGGTFNSKVATYRSANKVYDSKSSQSYARQKLAKTSRLFLTSGALEPVPDGYEEKHSPFCYLLLDALETGDANGLPITLSWLHQQAQLNITESMYGFFGNNQPGSEFIIGGIKSQDNSTLVNKLLEEKALKEKAERRERETKSLLLTQKARESVVQKEYTQAVRNIAEAYALDSSNHLVQEVYYKMMLEKESIYFSQKLSSSPLPAQQLIVTDSTEITSSKVKEFEVDYESRKLLVQYEDHLEIIDFDGNILSKANFNDWISHIVFKNHKIYIYSGDRLVVLDEQLGLIKEIKIQIERAYEHERLRIAVSDNGKYIIFEHKKNNFLLYKDYKFYKKIDLPNVDYVQDFDFTKNNHFSFNLYQDVIEGLYIFLPVSFNSQGKQISYEPLDKNYYLNSKTIYNKDHLKLFYFHTEFNDLFIRINRDSLDDVFYRSGDYTIIRKKLELKEVDESSIQISESNIEIKDKTNNTKGYITLNDSIAVIAHTNDIQIRSIKDNKEINSFRISDFIKMLPDNTGENFYLLTKRKFQKFNLKGELKNEIALLQSSGNNFVLSPENQSIAINYKYDLISILDQDFNFKCKLLQADNRNIHFLSEDLFINYGLISEESPHKDFKAHIRVYATNGELQKELPGIIYLFSDKINRVERVRENHFILNTDEDKESYIYEIDENGDIIYDFLKVKYDDDVNQLEVNVYQFDEQSFIFNSNSTIQAYQWFNDEWVKVDSVEIIHSDKENEILALEKSTSSFWFNGEKSESKFIYRRVEYGQIIGPYIKTGFDKKNNRIQLRSITSEDGNNIQVNRIITSDSIIYGVDDANNFNFGVMNDGRYTTNFTYPYTINVSKSSVISGNPSFSPIVMTDKVEKLNLIKVHENTINIEYDDFIIINDSLVTLLYDLDQDQYKKQNVLIYNLNSRDIVYEFKDEYIYERCNFEYEVKDNILIISTNKGYESDFSVLVNLNTKTSSQFLKKRIKPRNIAGEYFMHVTTTSTDINGDTLYLLNTKTFETVSKIKLDKIINEYEGWDGFEIDTLSRVLLDSKFSNGNYYLNLRDSLFQLDLKQNKVISKGHYFLWTEKDKIESKVDLNEIHVYKKIYKVYKDEYDTTYSLTFGDSVIKKINIPLNNDKPTLLLSDDNYVVVQNEKKSYFFIYSEQENDLKYLGENSSYDDLNYIKSKKLFIAVKNNEVSFLDSFGKQLSVLRFTKRIKSATIHDNQLRLMITDDHFPNGDIYLEGDVDFYHVPLFKHGLEKLKRQVLFME